MRMDDGIIDGFGNGNQQVMNDRLPMVWMDLKKGSTMVTPSALLFKISVLCSDSLI